MRVLVVEDNRVMVEWLRFFLDLHQIDATIIDRDFDTLADNIPDGYDVLICDLMLPGISGETIMRQAKAQHPHMRRVAYSAAAYTALLLDPGLPDHILLKGPDNGPELLEIIRRV